MPAVKISGMLRRDSAKSLKRLGRVFLCLLLLWFSCDIYLQSRGYRPEHTCAQFAQIEPDRNVFDSEIGWLNYPGRHRSLESPAGKTIWESIWPDGSRVSRPDFNRATPYRVMVLGCSFTYGMGVEDYQTYVWQLNRLFPRVTFDNFGAVGYGTCQAYLTEKRLFELNRQKYDLVLYAPMQSHPLRNVNPFVVNFLNPRQQFLGVDEPYILPPIGSLDSHGKLCISAPISRWLGDSIFTTINFFKRMSDFRAVQRTQEPGYRPDPQWHLVYLRLLQQMDAEAKQHGARFAVCCLDSSDNDNLQLPVRCNLQMNLDVSAYEDIPEQLPFPYGYMGNERLGHERLPKFYVNGDLSNHPSALVHRGWALNIAQWLEEERLLQN